MISGKGFYNLIDKIIESQPDKDKLGDIKYELHYELIRLDVEHEDWKARLSTLIYNKHTPDRDKISRDFKKQEVLSTNRFFMIKDKLEFYLDNSITENKEHFDDLMESIRYYTQWYEDYPIR